MKGKFVVTIVLRRSCRRLIVPLAMEAVSLDSKRRHLGIADLASLLVFAIVQMSKDFQACRRSRRADEIHDGLIGRERPCPPVGRDSSSTGLLSLCGRALRVSAFSPANVDARSTENSLAMIELLGKRRTKERSGDAEPLLCSSKGLAPRGPWFAGDRSHCRKQPDLRVDRSSSGVLLGLAGLGRSGFWRTEGLREDPVLADVGTAVHLAAGRYNSCAVLDTGEARCWGANLAGDLGYGPVASVGARHGRRTVLGAGSADEGTSPCAW